VKGRLAKAGPKLPGNYGIDVKASALRVEAVHLLQG